MFDVSGVDKVQEVTPSNSCDLTIVIPAFNERQRLPASLEVIRSYLEQAGRTANTEVLIVDDGSEDGTYELRHECTSPFRFLQQIPNRGKGAALRLGVSESRGATVLLCDADLSTPIWELETLEQARAERGVEIAFGSRATAQSDIRVRQPGYRQWMGKTFNRGLWVLGIRGIRDTQCGFKLLAGDVARELFAEMHVDRFAFDVELLLRARRRGYRVVEVGVRWDHVEESRVSPIRDAARMAWDVLLVRLRMLKE